MSSTSCNSRFSTYVFASRLCLLRAGLTIFVKRCCTISGSLLRRLHLLPVASWSLASQRENPIHYLPPSFCGKTPLGLRLFQHAFGFWCKIIGPLVVWRLIASLSLELRESFFQFNQPIFTNLKKMFEHIELPAKLLDHFLRSNKNNINQSILLTPLGSVRISWHSLCTFSLLMLVWGLSNQLDLGTPA